MHRLLLAAFMLAFSAWHAAVAFPAAKDQEVVSRPWPHQGPFSGFDRAALMRGFQVYRNVCASCHALGLVSYGDLVSIGFPATEAEAIAAREVIKEISRETGETVTRAARLSDRFAAPYPHNQAARAANNGLLPPDLSQIIKTRGNAENYFYSVLVGVNVQPRLADNAVSYADGTRATSGQMAADVVAFLAWTAEPMLEERRRLGLYWMLFLAVLTGFLFLLKRRIWSRLD